MDDKTQRKLTGQVAKRLKLFRKKRGMSVSAFAERIHKSPVTVYKYESGAIPIDMDVLEEIARVLGVAPAYFFDPPTDGWDQRIQVDFMKTGRLYIYQYDGRIRRVSQSLLSFGGQEGEEVRAVLYMDVRNFAEPENARYLYYGRMIPHETVSSFILENITLPMETLTLQILHPFQNSMTSWGLLMCMSDYPSAPMSTKILVSLQPFSEAELKNYPLVFTREEMRTIRQRNAIVLYAWAIGDSVK